MRPLKLVLAVLALTAVVGARAAERIEWWRTTPRQPTESTPDETGAEATADEENRPAELLAAAATRARLPLVGEVMGATAEQLVPLEPDAEPGPPPLPDWAAREQFGDYALVAAAAAEYTHPQDQVLRCALYQFETAADAWGLWSRGRGEQEVRLGQQAVFGRELRVWEGRLTAVMTLEPADERMDETRLTKFGRSLFALIADRGTPPTMVDWLPTLQRIDSTITYFHAQAPQGTAAMSLSQETAGVSAQYRMTEEGAPYGGAIVRYPDRETALQAWRVFVAAQLGEDPDTGMEGARRTGASGGWCGVRMKGNCSAYVFGCPTRTQCERFLDQATGRISGTGQ